MTYKTKLLTIIIIFVSTSSHAALVSRLGGLAYYDTEANLTWLADAAYLTTQYANSGGTEGDADGRVSWAAASSLIADLSVTGVMGWRLPATFDAGNDGCNFSYSGTDCGFNVNPASSELANLFINVLGIVSSKNTDGSSNSDWSPGITNSGPFNNIQNGYYWSSTEYAPDSLFAWAFNTQTTNQLEAIKTGSSLRVWAVQSGDVAAVPTPPAIALFITGLFGLLKLAKRKRA